METTSNDGCFLNILIGPKVADILFQIVTFNDKDLLWTTSNLKDKLNCKNSIYKNDLKNS